MRSSSMALALLASALVAVLACGREQTFETPDGTVTLDRGEEKMTFSAKGEEGFEAQAGEGVELPNNFPKDVPLYPDAKLLASMSSKEGAMVSTQSRADPTDVIAFYTKELSGEGWEIQAEMTMGPQRMVSFAKGDRQVTLTATREEDQTQISLMASW